MPDPSGPADESLRLLEIRKLQLEVAKLDRELAAGSAQDLERRLKIALDISKAALTAIGAVVVFLVINRAESLLRARVSEEEMKRERARLVLECLESQDSLLLYRCTQTIYDAYSDASDPTSTDWLRNLRDTASAEIRAKVAPKAATNIPSVAVSGERGCDGSDGVWWKTGDWIIGANAEQMNPEAVPHGWVPSVSERMTNLPIGATGSMIVLHPLTPDNPAVLQFNPDRLSEIAGKKIQVTAAGSPYGDGVIQLWANGGLSTSAVVSGARWSVLATVLPENLQELELRSAAGGVGEWYFETAFIKQMCFSDS